jgi:hypothetical protein
VALKPAGADGILKAKSFREPGLVRQQFTLEYWQDGAWTVGRLVEVPGVFSRGKTLAKLCEYIQDAYELMVVGPNGAGGS